MSSHVPEFLDQQVEALARLGQDLTAEQVRIAATEFRALERRVAELEAENSRLARSADAAIRQLKAA